ncbi:hypothetical protein ACQPW3_38225 [Actinosynnema sp. CA-248983]
MFDTLQHDYGITTRPAVDPNLIVRLDEGTFARHFAVQQALDEAVNTEDRGQSDLTTDQLTGQGIDPEQVRAEILSPDFLARLNNGDPDATARLDQLLDQIAQLKAGQSDADAMRQQLIQNTLTNPARAINGHVLLNTGHLNGLSTDPARRADAIRHLLVHEFMHAHSVGSDQTFAHRHGEGGLYSANLNPDEAMTEMLARRVTDALAGRLGETPQYNEFPGGGNRYQDNVDRLATELNRPNRDWNPFNADQAFRTMLNEYFGATPATQTPPPADDNGAPPPPAPRTRPAPPQAIPMVVVTPPVPTTVLPGPLPEFFQSNQALGTIATNDVQGAAKVTRALTALLTTQNPNAEQLGVDHIGHQLDTNFESFLGPGRTFQVKVGGTWLDAKVQAVLHSPAADPTSTPPQTTKVDMQVNSGATTSTTTNLTTANSVGVSASASQGLGAYGALSVSTPLSTPATTVTTSTSAVDNRVIRAGETSTQVDVPVSVLVTLSDPVTGTVLDQASVRTDDDGPVGVSLQIPDDLRHLGPGLPGEVKPPKDDWGTKVEHVVPEAVYVNPADANAAYQALSGALHPSITLPGADGRTALRDFLSGTSIRDNLGPMLGGWVTSPNLTSPNGGHTGAVRMTAHPVSAELLGTHDAAQLRLHDATTTGTGTSSTVSSGVDVSAAVGGGVGAPSVGVGSAGLTGGYGAKTSVTANTGTTTTNKTGIQVKGDTGLYKVTTNVEVQTSNGKSHTFPVTSYVRMGLHEAAAHGLPTPPGTRDTLTKDTKDGKPRYEPLYLSTGLAAGNIRVGEFAPASNVQPAVEKALRDLPGFAGLLPSWDKPGNRLTIGHKSAELAQQLANQRKLDAELSPTALKSKMDSLLGPGVQFQFKREGKAHDNFVNVKITAKLAEGTHLGEADARNIRGSSSTAPKLDSAATTQKGFSVGVEGRGGASLKPPGASVSPTATLAAKYNQSTAVKTTAGPTVASNSLHVGSADAQVFAHRVDFTIEITEFSRTQAWVKRVTVGSPYLQVPDPKTVATITSADNPDLGGKVHLWVSDGSALKTDQKAFKPGDPTTVPLPPTVTVSSVLNPPTAKPKQPDWLHVEAVANAETLRDNAIKLLNEAAGGKDTALTAPGTESRNQIDKMFAPENLKANLRKMTETGVGETGLRYDRRVADRTGAIGMSVELSGPRLVSVSDVTPTENSTTGGSKAAETTTENKSVDGTASVGFGARPSGASPKGASGFTAQGKWTPWSKSAAKTTEVGGSVDRNLVTPPAERTVLVQMDATFTVATESRNENMAHKGTSQAKAAAVLMPGGVFVRVSEQTAREMGLLPDVKQPEPAKHGTMQPPKRLTPNEPGALGLSLVDKAPDLSATVKDLAAQVNKDTKLIPDSVLDDSMGNLQRLVDLTSPTGVKALVDSALDGGVPLLLHKPGTVIGKDSYQVTLKAHVGAPVFDKAVNDGRDIEHTVAGTRKNADAQGKGTSWGLGVKVPGSAVPDASGNLSGNVGVAVGANVGVARSKTTTDATTDQFGHLHAGSGPAVRYDVPVRFELVVEKGSKVVGRAVSPETTLGVRLHADSVRVQPPTGPEARDGYRAEATGRLPADAASDQVSAWQSAGVDLPTTASVEGMRGAADVRRAAIAALQKAGAGSGITGKGTAPLNALLSTLSSEHLQAGLPGMTKEPLDVPGLHESTLGSAQHADLKVYARLVNPKLGSLSDSVNLENPTTTVHAVSTDVKSAQTGDVSIGIAGGGFSQADPDPVRTPNFTTGGIEGKHASEASTTDSSGPTGNKVQNLKPQGRTGLVEFDVEYRLVADLGGGKVGVYDLTVPGSADVRMPSAEVEKLLGPIGDDLGAAQKQVADTAKAWRTAEVAVDDARHAAQDLITDSAAAKAEAQKAVTDAHGTLEKAVEARDKAAQDLPDLEKALEDARIEEQKAADDLRDRQNDIPDLERLARRTAEFAKLADEDVKTTGEAVGAQEERVRTATERLRLANENLEAANQALATFSGPPEERGPLETGVQEATEDVESRTKDLKKLEANLKAAQDEHQTALDEQKESAEAAEKAAKNLEDARKAEQAAGERLTLATTALVQAELDLKPVAEATAQAELDRQAAQAHYDQAVEDGLRIVEDADQAILDAETTLAERRADADAEQAKWWAAKSAVDQQITTYNTTPPTPPDQPPAPPVESEIQPAPPQAPAPRGVPVQPMADPLPVTPRSAPTGPAPERSFDFTDDLSDTQRTQLDDLATQLTEATAQRDRLGYLPPTVEVSGANAATVAQALAQQGIESKVTPGRADGVDVKVDWDLKRPEGYVAPTAPVGTKVTETVITAQEPSRSVLDDQSWRHSTTPDAEWFTPTNPVPNTTIEQARTTAPVTSTVRGEDSGVMANSAVTPDGITLNPWRGPIAYDVRTMAIDGVEVHDLTVRLHLDGHPDQAAAVQERTRAGIEELFNQGNRLPGGGQLHVTVEFTNDPSDAHATVALTDPNGRADQLSWPVDTDPRRLAHEVGHFLGLQDEYLEPDAVKPVFQHQDGKGRVVADNAPMTAGIDAADTALKPRNAWLIESRMKALESFDPPTAEPWSDTAPPPNAPTKRTVDAMEIDDVPGEQSNKRQEREDDDGPSDVDEDVEMTDDDSVTLDNAGGIQNTAFENLAQGRALTPITPGDYLDRTRRSIEHNEPPAFVVNMIVRAGELDQLDTVIAGVMANTPPDLHGRVAFVLGVNAPTRAEIDTALAQVAATVQARPEPIALVNLPHPNRGFAFGETRNRTMDSNAHRFAVHALAANGTHPYVSVMDFDASDRRTPSGQHVFSHVTTLMDATDVDDNPEPLRPLLVGGGYRVTDPRQLVQDTLARINADQTLHPDTRQSYVDTVTDPDFVARFEQQVAADMHARRNQSGIHPLLPYTPEPNLFVDALVPLVDGTVRFGPDGAEFGGLGRSLNRFHATELAAVHEPDLTHDNPADVRERVNVDAQNNRHPVRGQAFTTDFVDGATGTDLSRLAYGQLKDGKLPQSHTALPNVTERFVANKKAKEGTRFANQRTEAAAGRVPEPFPVPPPGQTSTTWNPSRTTQTQLGAPKKNALNPAVSTPVPAPFQGVTAGIQPEHKVVSAHGLVTSDHVSEARRHLRFIAGDLLPTAPPPTADGLYAAVGQAAGVDPVTLRHGVVTMASSDEAAQTVAEFTVARPMRRGHLYGALVEHLNWSFRDPDENARAGNARDLTARLIATRLGVNVVIHQGGAPTVLHPLNGPAQHSVEIELVVVNGVATYRRR